MTRLAPTPPTRKGSREAAGIPASGWRSVELDGIPGRSDLPVFVVREGGFKVCTPIIAVGIGGVTPPGVWQVFMVGSENVASARPLRLPVCAADWWIPVARLRAMVRVVARSRRRGL